MAKRPASTWHDWLGNHGSRLMLYSRQLTRCEADAEDVLQNALAKTWRSARDPYDPESCRGLLFTNIRREAIDLGRHLERLRSRNENYNRQEQIDAATQESWFELPDDDDNRQLQVALAALPAKYREVISLKIWGELTFSEISAALQIPANTAASRYRYGLAALRRRLSEATST